MVPSRDGVRRPGGCCQKVVRPLCEELRPAALQATGRRVPTVSAHPTSQCSGLKRLCHGHVPELLCQKIGSSVWNWHTRVPTSAVVASQPRGCGSKPACLSININNYNKLGSGTQVALGVEHGDSQLFACSFGSRSVLRHAGTSARSCRQVRHNAITHTRTTDTMYMWVSGRQKAQ